MKQYADGHLTSNVIQPKNKYWDQLIASNNGFIWNTLQKMLKDKSVKQQNPSEVHTKISNYNIIESSELLQK